MSFGNLGKMAKEASMIAFLGMVAACFIVGAIVFIQSLLGLVG